MSRSTSLPTSGRSTSTPHQLENAIVNLAVNARDAMEGEGLMRVTAAT
jgi:signal transduction histidine kinase